MRLVALLSAAFGLSAAQKAASVAPTGRSGEADFFQGPRQQEQAFKLNASALSYTGANGAPYFLPLGAQRAGPRGPLLLQDTQLIDALAHFNRERIPERVVHARGLGAHGYFEVTTDFASKYSVADVFQPGTKTSVSMRFSTVGGGRGSADTARDPRGFSIKFRTKKGILDWVFNNTPVFFIRDPAKFPRFIHTQKTHPATNTRDWSVFWSWPARFPESLLQFLRLFSDLGTPYGVRYMHGWSGHTYRLVKADGSWVYVKVRVTSEQGIKNFTAAEATKIAGENDAWATQDLYDSIAAGKYPAWKVEFAIKTKKEADAYRYDVLDLTKDWYDATWYEVGRIVLNKNPDNYFAEVEQAHYSPANIVPGWAPSADPVLQSRLFAYNDAGRHRLGPNAEQIPVNAPINTVANWDRDGAISVDGNQGSRPNYPSFLDELQVPEKPATALEDELEGRSTVFWESKIDPKLDYEQPKQFYEKQLSENDRKNLHSNIAGTLVNVKEKAVLDKLFEQFGLIDEKLLAGVKAAFEVAQKNAPPTDTDSDKGDKKDEDGYQSDAPKGAITDPTHESTKGHNSDKSGDDKKEQNGYQSQAQSGGVADPTHESTKGGNADKSDDTSNDKNGSAGAPGTAAPPTGSGTGVQKDDKSSNGFSSFSPPSSVSNPGDESSPPVSGSGGELFEGTDGKVTRKPIGDDSAPSPGKAPPRLVRV